MPCGALRACGEKDKLIPLVTTSGLAYKEIASYFANGKEFYSLNGATIFHVACTYHKNELLKYLLESTTINPNKRNRKGYAPLHTAICSDNEIAISYLLASKRVDYEAAITKSHKRSTPFYLACRYGNIRILKLLVKRGCDIFHIPDPENPYSALHLACKYGNCKVVAYLLKLGLLPSLFPNSIHPLYVACLHGHLKIVKLLLAHMAANDLNSFKEILPTVLPATVQNRNKNSTMKLLQFFFSLESTTYTLNITECSYRFQEPFIHAMVNRGEKLFSSLWAVMHNQIDLNALDKSRRNALHIAVLQRNPALVSTLLDLGINPNVTCRGKSKCFSITKNVTSFSFTPTQMAVHLQDITILRLLLQSPILEFSQMKDPLVHVAARNESVDILKSVLEHPQVSVADRDFYGNFPLHVATPSITAFLLTLPEVDLNATNFRGETAVACVSTLEKLKIMCEHPQVALDITDSYGKTLFELHGKKKEFLLYLLDQTRCPQITKQVAVKTFEIYARANISYPLEIGELGAIFCAHVNCSPEELIFFCDNTETMIATKILKAITTSLDWTKPKSARK